MGHDRPAIPFLLPKGFFSVDPAAVFSYTPSIYFKKGKNDGFVKSRFSPDFVIPAKAGIQLDQATLGSRLRGSDGFSNFLRDH
jgi:hypothetical protein